MQIREEKCAKCQFYENPIFYGDGRPPPEGHPGVFELKLARGARLMA